MKYQAKLINKSGREALEAKLSKENIRVSDIKAPGNLEILSHVYGSKPEINHRVMINTQSAESLMSPANEVETEFITDSGP